MISFRLIYFLVTCFVLPCPAEGAVRAKELKLLVKEDAVLECPVPRSRCGDVHTIKWYKDQERIFIHSEIGSLSRSENSLVGRTKLLESANGTSMDLRIFSVAPLDSGRYKCDITYLDVRDGCAVVHLVDVDVRVPPEYVALSLRDGTAVANGSSVGPFYEGAELEVTCESGGGRPFPSVSWWSGDRRLSGTNYSTSADGSGTGSSRSRLKVALGRSDIGARFRCSAENEVSERPLVVEFAVDVYVAPMDMEMVGLRGPVKEGTHLSLSCKVSGAKPAANVSWFNGSMPVTVKPQVTVRKQEDGTLETESILSFEASRFENSRKFRCQATNEVLESNVQSPLIAYTVLDVLYAPFVAVSPDNVTVAEETDFFLICSYDANPANLTRVIWYRDAQEIYLDPDKYSGGYADVPSLMIRNVSRDDAAEYSCFLENEIGIRESRNRARLNVLHVPEVRIEMVPAGPVTLTVERNVTLRCATTAGYPRRLEHVKWFFNDAPFRECQDNHSVLYYDFTRSECDDGAQALFLRDVSSSSSGNYSCQGKNQAGWSAKSSSEGLVVHYAPGDSFLTYHPLKVVKKSSVTLTCNVFDPGHPKSSTYKWYRNGVEVKGINSSSWTIDPVGVETEANFSCSAVNFVGESPRNPLELKVYAAPAFIERLPPYYGVRAGATAVSLTCQVECIPLCRVEWIRNGRALLGSKTYSISSTVTGRNPMTGDLESVVSTLTWNLDAFPGGRLDRHSDGGNYTCRSSGNRIGPGVSSTTLFRVEFSPENVSLSREEVHAVEGERAPPVSCSADAYPAPTYNWTFHGDRVATGRVLDLDRVVARRDAGVYTCVAWNRHGNASAGASIHVHYKPECAIERQEEEGRTRLVCEVSADPDAVDFRWERDNRTLEEEREEVTTERLRSVLTLRHGADRAGMYRCFANNSVGTVDRPCEIDVRARHVARPHSWWRFWTQPQLWLASVGVDDAMLAAIVCGALVVLALLLVLAVWCCRRRREKVDARGGAAGSMNERRFSSSEEADWPAQEKTPPARPPPPRPRALDQRELRASPRRDRHRRRRRTGSSGRDDPSRTNRLDGQEDRLFYENLPFHGLQAPPNKVGADGPRPPSRLSQNGSSGYGSTHSQLDAPPERRDTALARGVLETRAARLRLATFRQPSFRSAALAPGDTHAGGAASTQQLRQRSAPARAGSAGIGAQWWSSQEEPLKTLFSDLEYADVDYRAYEPVNYKRLSRELAEERRQRAAPRGSLPPRPPRRKASGKQE